MSKEKLFLPVQQPKQEEKAQKEKSPEEIAQALEEWKTMRKRMQEKYTLEKKNVKSSNEKKKVTSYKQNALSLNGVIITGDKTKEAFRQLQASTSLKLKIDETGKITAEGKAKTEADKKLLEAIMNQNITVQIHATSSNFVNDKWFVGGTFGGSRKEEDGKIYTSQTVNPEQTKIIDNFYETPKGVSLLHEVLESYIGGKESPGIGSPTFEDVETKTETGIGYLKAHNQAEIIDPRHISPNIIADHTGIYISKFPYDSNIPKSLNPEILINDLKK